MRCPDVAILYQIIKSAEQDPEVESHPFRAIFSAYDTVLPENGLDSDHDQVYLRFLFRLGDRREGNEPLFETFEKLLDELGIQIEFNTEEEGIHEVTRNLTDHGYDDAQGQKGAEVYRRAPRAPFSTMYDADNEGAGVGRSRADSRASMSRLEVKNKVAAEERPASRATTRLNERMSNFAALRKAPASTVRPRLTAEEWTQDLQQQLGARESRIAQRQAETHSHSPNALVKPPQSIADLHKDDSSLTDGDGMDETDMERAAQSRHQEILKEHHFVLGNSEKLYALPRTQLLRDANTFQSYRIRSVARDAVEKWCYAALEAKNHHEHMYRIASAYDLEVLLHQAFEHWRLRLHERKKALETKRYFDRLGRRAAKARDLFLLTKAFTHWSQCVQDEVQRTSLARQHLLSVKYFHAWKCLTIVNQEKVHLQGLHKYFGVWRRRYFQVVTNDIKADLAERRRLIKSAYWHWFWGFCEACAPEWQARRLKQRLLLKWADAFRINRQRNQQVTLHIEIASKRFFVSTWLEKARKTLQNQTTAATYSRQTLTSYALRTWVRRRKYGPLVQQVSNMADWRVAGATFELFVHKFRLQKQSENLNRLRILRNIWTQWNDHLRWQTLARRLDDRYLLEALYKWTIAERLILLRRLSKQRLKERYLIKLRDQWLRREAERNDASRIIETQFTRRSLHLILSHWRLRCGKLHQDRQIALEFHAPKVTYEALQSLTQRLEQVQRMNRMANDAAFYFTTKRSLKRWHNATIESKRQKRRTAYIQIRRETKMKLASNMLQRWRCAIMVAHHIADKADLFNQDRLFRLATSLYHQWRTSFDLTIDLQFQATSHYEEQLLLRHLRNWSERTVDVTELDRKAFLKADLHRQKLAFNCLNRLRLRLIEIKGPQATAENLSIRYQKRHFHNILRHWQDQTAKRLDRPLPSRAAFSSHVRRSRLLAEGDGRLGATTRAEEWTELDQGDWIPQLEAQSSTTPMPGYLNTPSKRAARARAIQESTTPRGTPFQTRLRAQLNATPGVTTKRGLFGRSATRPREDSFGGSLLPVEGSGSTTVVDRDE